MGTLSGYRLYNFLARIPRGWCIIAAKKTPEAWREQWHMLSEVKIPELAWQMEEEGMKRFMEVGVWERVDPVTLEDPLDYVPWPREHAFHQSIRIPPLEGHQHLSLNVHWHLPSVGEG